MYCLFITNYKFAVVAIAHCVCNNIKTSAVLRVYIGQPKAVHYIAPVYDMFSIQLSICRNKDFNCIFHSRNVLAYVRVKLLRLTSFRSALQLIGMYPPH